MVGYAEKAGQPNAIEVMKAEREKITHTPGPWFADMGDGDYWVVGDQDGRLVACLVEPTPRAEARRFELLPRDDEFERARSDASHLGDDAPHYPHWATQEANARLIAAAPTMLEALKKAEQWLSGWASAEPYIDEIRAAIALASGAKP